MALVFSSSGKIFGNMDMVLQKITPNFRTVKSIKERLRENGLSCISIGLWVLNMMSKLSEIVAYKSYNVDRNTVCIRYISCLGKN